MNDLVATVQDEISAVLARTDRARLEAAVAELDAAQRVFVESPGGDSIASSLREHRGKVAL